MIKVAIWGAGAIARTHIDAYNKQPELCKIVAVINWHTDKAEKLIRDKGLDAVACADLNEALSKMQIDAVSICLPPAQHADAVCQAAENHIHALVEKPMANSLADCDRMIKAAEKNGILLSSVCQKRFTTDAQKVHRIINEGTAGKLLYGCANSMWWRGTQYHDLCWRGTWEVEGGGVLTIQAIHHLDLLLYMMGMPERVTAVMSNVGHDNSQCEDVATAVLEYPDRFAQFSASQVAHGEKHEMFLYTELGRLSIPWEPAAMRAMPNGFPEDAPDNLEKLEKLYADIPELRFSDHAGQVLNFLNAINGKEKLVVDGYEGRKVIEMITAIYESACLRRTVELPLQTTDPFYTSAGKTALLPHFHEKKKSVSAMAEGEITLA